MVLGLLESVVLQTLAIRLVHLHPGPGYYITLYLKHQAWREWLINRLITIYTLIVYHV